MTRAISLWAPVVAYMALIFMVSGRPVPPDVEHLLPDKLVHAGEYAVLAALLVRACAGGWPRPLSMGVCVTAVILAVAYGVSDELHQSLVPARRMDAADLLADTVGAVCAATALYAWGIIRARNAL